MLERPPDKLLFKAYYSLVLLHKIKQQAAVGFKNLSNFESTYQHLIEQDFQETDECIALFKDLLNQCDMDAVKIAEFLEQDPYYTILQIIAKDQENNS